MENLLDYLLCALMGHNVTSVQVNNRCDPIALRVKTWTFCLENEVYFTLDETDLQVIRTLYDERYEWLDDGDRSRYLKIFNACV